MKKVKSIFSILLLFITLNSCATIFIAGKASECQRTKPKQGQPQREVRIGCLILDVLICLPSTIVDFADAKIYKPCK
jgi:hypothetical protein